MNHFKKNKNKSEKLRGIFFQMGLIIAGGLTLLAFEWTSPIYSYDLPEPIYIAEEEWDVPTIIPEKEIEKPEVKKTEKEINKEIIEIVKNEFVEKKEEKKEDPKKDMKFNETWVEKEVIVEEKIHLTAEYMPEFEGGVEKLFQYLGANLKYPSRDKDAGIQGTVYLQFVVGKKGEIRDVKILRGVSELIDKEALRVVKAMPTWKPGKQSGRPVSVMYNLPIKFKIKG